MSKTIPYRTPQIPKRFMDRAIVLGNGRSRLGLDLPLLGAFYRIYGCNALYRDYKPDVLVVVDSPMAKEIQESGYAKRNVVFTRNVANCPDAFQYNGDAWSAGPTAAHLAASLEPRPKCVFLIGFDMFPTDDTVNNVYIGTDNYAKENQQAPCGQWLVWATQLTSVFIRFPETLFVRVGRVLDPVPDRWMRLDNLLYVDRKTWLETLTEEWTDAENRIRNCTWSHGCGLRDLDAFCERNGITFTRGGRFRQFQGGGQ